MIRLKIEVTGKNAQGLSVVKKEHVFEANLNCGEEAEIAVAEMVAEHMRPLAVDLEKAALDARMVGIMRDVMPVRP